MLHRNNITIIIENCTEIIYKCMSKVIRMKYLPIRDWNNSLFNRRTLISESKLVGDDNGESMIKDDVIT